jgi:hypothetical protein
LLDALAFELHQAAEAFEAFAVAAAIAGFKHPDAVDDRGDRRAGAAAEVLAEGSNAQVVVAAGAPWRRDDPQLAGARPRFDRVRGGKARRVDRPPIRPSRVEVVEGPSEAAQVLLSQRGDDAERLRSTQDEHRAA